MLTFTLNGYKKIILQLFLFTFISFSYSTIYHVGPTESLTDLSLVPWANLNPGDQVLIDYTPTPYRTKFVIAVYGTPDSPIVISGVLGPNGERPIINGSNANTPSTIDFWNQNRGIFKIGGADTPNSNGAANIIISNLAFVSARPPYSFTDNTNSLQYYQTDAACIYVETGANITLYNNEVNDCGNGIFVSIPSVNVTIDSNYIWGNGNVGSSTEHNTYTESQGITYQYNRFEPLCNGCLGCNLKDRSLGMVVRYNWIEGGDRNLDLVDIEDDPSLSTDPRYHISFVYGNILIKYPNNLNPEVTHYGGDSGNYTIYRKGTLYFYDNTIYSNRTDENTLFNLDTNDESCDFRNNIVYVTTAPNYLALLDQNGTLTLNTNLIYPGYVQSLQDPFNGIVYDSNSITSNPDFVSIALQDFYLNSSSPAISKGIPLNPTALSNGYIVNSEYVKDQMSQARCATKMPSDLGAFEYNDGSPCPAAELASSKTKSSGNSNRFNIALLCVIVLYSAFTVYRNN